jgi:hypothetical protein
MCTAVLLLLLAVLPNVLESFLLLPARLLLCPRHSLRLLLPLLPHQKQPLLMRQVVDCTPAAQQQLPPAA